MFFPSSCLLISLPFGFFFFFLLIFKLFLSSFPCASTFFHCFQVLKSCWHKSVENLGIKVEVGVWRIFFFFFPREKWSVVNGPGIRINLWLPTAVCTNTVSSQSVLSYGLRTNGVCMYCPVIHVFIAVTEYLLCARPSGFCSRPKEDKPTNPFLSWSLQSNWPGQVAIFCDCLHCWTVTSIPLLLPGSPHLPFFLY